MLAARTDFYGPGMLRLKSRKDQAVAGVVTKINHVVKGGRLPTSAEIRIDLTFVIQFVDQSDLWIHRGKFQVPRLVANRGLIEKITEPALHKECLKTEL